VITTPLPYDAFYQDPAATLVHPVLRRLYDYWRDRAAGRIGPRRDDIDPVDFAYAVGWTSLIEVRDGGRSFEARVLGGRTASAIGLPGTASRDSDFDDPELLASAGRNQRWVVRHRLPVRLLADLHTARRHYRMEVLLLPLSEDGVTVDRLLTALIPPIGG